MDFYFTPEGFEVEGGGSYGYSELYEEAFRPERKDASLTEKYLARIARTFLSVLMDSTGLELMRDKVEINYEGEALDELVQEVPLAVGSQYITSSWLKRQLGALEKIYRSQIKSFKGSVDLYLNQKNEALQAPCRIYFHLVENAKGKTPFAFAATYSTVGDDGLVHHYPLRYALHEYRKDLDGLATLLVPLSHLSRSSELVRHLVESGEIFHAVNFTTREAYSYLIESSLYEEEGIVCRIPPFWKRRHRSTSVSLTLELKTRLDANALLSFRPSLVYQGVQLTSSEIKKLLSQSEGLAELKGRWVEIDHKRLQDLLETFSLFEEGVGMGDAIAFSSGLKETKVPVRFADANWLSSAFKKLSASYTVPAALNATLRPYQEEGYRYLMFMSQLGLGLCLADDMGLGKTVQVLAYLLEKRSSGTKRVLLIVPSSLIGNWMGEIAKFSPSLEYAVYHGKDRDLPEVFLTITTYALAARDIESLSAISWDEVILDEAQSIKNAATKQAKAIHSLSKEHGMVLTGTPIENSLANLWSLMDFAQSGLLGNRTAFTRYASKLEGDGLVRFKAAVRPFILRRLKTDRRIIRDLPQKIDNDMMASLTKKQIVLYEKVVGELEKKVAGADGESGKKALILPAIMRLKQICNHPDQYNGLEGYSEKESGKFALLGQIASSIAEAHEKVLVFTQFVEIIPHLDSYLASIFGAKGAVIDGSMSPKQRTEVVSAFQKGEYPYLVLSLRAAGVGLNLTAAANVIHFDRWWNPAVENQATDRAYRIGQKQRVMVYRFITKDTIEERIDELIKEKQALSDSILGDSSSDILSTLSADEIMAALRYRREVEA